MSTTTLDKILYTGRTYTIGGRVLRSLTQPRAARVDA